MTWHTGPRLVTPSGLIEAANPGDLAPFPEDAPMALLWVDAAPTDGDGWVDMCWPDRTGKSQSFQTFEHGIHRVEVYGLPPFRLVPQRGVSYRWLA